MGVVERSVTVRNELGLHLRPSGEFVKLAATFQCNVLVSKDGGDAVNGKSILGLVTLGAEAGSQLTIRGDGEDAEHAVVALSRLVERGFA